LFQFQNLDPWIRLQ